MARQMLSQKKVNKLRDQTGLDITCVLVRGNTDHRKDLIVNGVVYSLYKDGTIVKEDL